MLCCINAQSHTTNTVSSQKLHSAKHYSKKNTNLDLPFEFALCSVQFLVGILD